MARDRVLFQRGDDFRTLDSWGLVLCEAPIQVMSNVKEPYKNDWPDEHGDEEWNESAYYEAYEADFTFAAKKDGYTYVANTVVSDIRDFISWLNGGEFMFWCEYGNLGRQHVRYAGYDDDAKMWSMNTGRIESHQRIVSTVLRFKLKLKVNDPVSRVVPNATYTGLRVL